ncbi:hypothetical protein GGF31_005765 [Allomyces arbusculus]|nr:hypothetical protein GGF31_005765 [Allomyces arbusculus]
MTGPIPDERPPIDLLAEQSRKRTRAFFALNSGLGVLEEPSSQRLKLTYKYDAEYKAVQVLPAAAVPKARTDAAPTPPVRPLAAPGSTAPVLPHPPNGATAPSAAASGPSSSQALALIPAPTTQKPQAPQGTMTRLRQSRSVPPPRWHAPWKLMRVISGHTGWVRSVAVDVSNEWFVTGGGDRLIKIWDLASGQLKLTLTGHISPVRGLAVSARHPYLFSAGEDKMVKCWDLETNKVIRHYHGHLSGVYALNLHPTLDLIATGGRDSTIRLWDMRTKQQVHVLTGHSQTVGTLLTQGSEFQLVSGSFDSTVKLWDIRMGKCKGTLTHHKKSVRALAMHPNESTFVSGSPDNIKQWVMHKDDPQSEFPNVRFVQNFSGQQGIVNCLAANHEGVLFSGGDNGSMHFWDWRTGYNFQSLFTTAQPGSLASEAGIFAATFDQTGSRLITCEADKSIKIWKEDDKATPESHPMQWRPELKKTRY